MRNDGSKKLPRGVSFDKTHRGRAKYKTRVFHNGKDRFIGRFETVEQASKAYQQALSAFRKKSPAGADSSEFLQQVRALVHGNGAVSTRDSSGSSAERIKARESFETSVPPTSSSQLLEKLPSLPGSLLRQLSLPCSHSNSVNSGSYAGDVNPTTAAAAAALDSMQLDCGIPAAYMPYNGGYAANDIQGRTDQHVEDVMARELFKALDTGALFPNAQQPNQQQQPTAQQAAQQQQKQQRTPGLMRLSSSCGDIAAAYMQLQHQHEEATARSCTLPTLTGAAAAAAATLTAPAYMQQQQQWQQPQQGARSCTLPTIAPTAAAAAVAGVQGQPQGHPCAEYGSCSAPLFPLQQQQQQQQQPQQDTEVELQQLLEMVLQEAGELEANIDAGAGAGAAVAPTLSPAELHELAVQQCCFEFLAATASPATSGTPAPAMQALSAPAGMNGHLGTAQLQLERRVGTALSGPPAAGATAPGAGAVTPPPPAAAASGVRVPTGRTSIGVSSGNTQILSDDAPGGLVRQDSLLMQTDTCLEAVLYVAAVARAVLDLYTAVLHRLFEEDAAADLLQWLSAFRQQQQQQYSGASSVAAAAGSPAAAANSEALNSSVCEVLGKMVCMLVAAGNSALVMPAQSSTVGSSSSRAGSPRRVRPGTPVACSTGVGTAVNAAAARIGGSGSAVPLASRAFVMAVLERLNGCLARLHAMLQQQQNLAARPAAMWQQVQCWMQQLHAQAATPEDHMAVQLAALI